MESLWPYIAAIGIEVKLLQRETNAQPSMKQLIDSHFVTNSIALDVLRLENLTLNFEKL